MKIRPLSPSPSRQRGAALLMAMIIVALVSTLATSMVWQQWRAVQVETAERARAQSAWILTGALDWGRLILKVDLRTDNNLNSGPKKTPQADHLGEPWAVPLAEARLSTFLAADKTDTSDGPEAFLSGIITDAQARFNLNNLIEDDPSTGEPRVIPGELARLGRLCGNLGIPVETAKVIADRLRDARAEGKKSAPTNPPLEPIRVDQLAWFAIDPKVLRRLEPYIIWLPDTKTPVNVNTASREVLDAVLGLNPAVLLQGRQPDPFRRLSDVESRLGLPSGTLQGVSVTSRYFEIRGLLRLEDRVLEQRSLVVRRNNRVDVLTRDNISSRDAGS